MVNTSAYHLLIHQLQNISMSMVDLMEISYLLWLVAVTFHSIRHHTKVTLKLKLKIEVNTSKIQEEKD